MPGWPWPDEHVALFARKCRRAVDSERVGELARSCLIWLALCGWAGRPVADLWGWTRSAPLDRLGGLLAEFDDPDLRTWIEKQVGFPDHSSGFGER